ncbi:MAG: hypothetical protein OXG15_01020 [Gammaproteobacteria bacterium]|nr:hypothetical protein [Gammaproteobacteria bacterium]
MRIGGSVLIAVVVLALIGGFVAGISTNSLLPKKQSDSVSRHHEPHSESTSESGPIPRHTATRSHAAALEDPVADIQSILDLSRFASDFDQSASLYAFLANAEEEDLIRYISDSSAISSINQRVDALSIIFGRYTAINPHEALKRALALKQLTLREKSNVIRAIFNEWTVQDSDRAVAAMKSLPHQFRFPAAVAVHWRSDFLSVDQRIQLAQQIDLNETWVANAIASIRSDAARGDPRTAFYDYIRKTSPSQDTHLELFGIARNWFELDGIAVLPEIYKSLPSIDARKYVLQGLVRHAIGTRLAQPATVLGVVAEIPNTQDARRAAEHAFRSWSEYDPKQSFEASIEFGDHLVTPRFRATLLQIWAAKDPEALLRNASALPRKYQDAAVVKGLGQLSIDTPDVAIRYARSLDTRPLRILARDEILTQWSSVDAKSAFEWLMDDGFDGSHRSNPSIWSDIFAKFLEQDVEAARTYAENYDGSLRNSLTESVARYLIHSDVERAIKYLPNLEDWRQSWLREHVGRKLVTVNANRAISYGVSLPKEFQRRYFTDVINEWAYRDLVNLTENIQLVPSEFRSIAAKEILGWNEERGYLSDHQITRLEAMAPSDEEELIVTSGGC